MLSFDNIQWATISDSSLCNLRQKW